MLQAHQLFKFPLNKDGYEWFSLIKDLKSTYRKDLQSFLKKHSKIQPFEPEFVHHTYSEQQIKRKNNKLSRKVLTEFKIRCGICSNTIIYTQKEGELGLTLNSFNFYHIHTNNRNKYVEFLSNKGSKFTMLMRKAFALRPYKKESDMQGGKQSQLMQFIESLPPSLNQRTRFMVMHNNFGISEDYFNFLTSKINRKSELSFFELINWLEERHYTYSYLPYSLPFLQNLRKSPERTCFLNKEQQPDLLNPELPNIMLISNQEMRDQFKNFGQFVSFDLTFSLIKQRTSDDKQYNIGIILGTNSSKKIVHFGLVITNSQSIFAYSWIFKEFFKMMRGVPDTIITDQQKAMHYALRELRKEGVFQGQHLFDVFHILRKFRKSSQKPTWKLIQKMIHAKDKITYRKLMRQAMAGVINDKQFQVLRNFDLNSDKYCFSQIQPLYIGNGASTSPNQHFHSFLKDQIPYALKYTKVVQMALQIIEQRSHFYNTPCITNVPYHKIFNFGLCAKLMITVSDKTFSYIMKELCKSPALKLLNFHESKNEDKENNKYYIKSGDGVYLVQKEYFKGSMAFSKEYKWSCSCELQAKSGYLCCHIGKILLLLNAELMNNINQRWRVNLQGFLTDQELREIDSLKMNRHIEQRLYLGLKFYDDRIRKNEIQKSEESQTQIDRSNLRWNVLQQVRYAKFLKENQLLMLTKPRNLLKKRQKFSIMSEYVRSRNSDQCESHHSTMIRRFGSIDTIIKTFLPPTEKKDDLKSQLQECDSQEQEELRPINEKKEKLWQKKLAVYKNKMMAKLSLQRG